MIYYWYIHLQSNSKIIYLGIIKTKILYYYCINILNIEEWSNVRSGIWKKNKNAINNQLFIWLKRLSQHLYKNNKNAIINCLSEYWSDCLSIFTTTIKIRLDGFFFHERGRFLIGLINFFFFLEFPALFSDQLFISGGKVLISKQW